MRCMQFEVHRAGLHAHAGGFLVEVLLTAACQVRAAVWPVA